MKALSERRREPWHAFYNARGHKKNRPYSKRRANWLLWLTYNGESPVEGELGEYGWAPGHWFVVTDYDLRKGTGLWRRVLPAPADEADAVEIARRYLGGLDLTEQQRRELNNWFRAAAGRYYFD